MDLLSILKSNDMYEMMLQEIKSLYHYELLSKDEYLKCILLINQRRNEDK